MLSITPDFDGNSLIIQIYSMSDGKLTISLPRSLTDAKIGNTDDDFFVLINGEVSDFDETKTAYSRTLTIAFRDGTEEIEIIGTHVFGDTPLPTLEPTPEHESVLTDEEKFEHEPVLTYEEKFEHEQEHKPYLPPGPTTVVIPGGTGVTGCEETRSCYDPYRITVEKHSTITWINVDTAAHTVTSGTPTGGPDGTFDSSLFMAGATFSHKFEEAGTYDYFCMIHPWMVGEVVVKGTTVTSILTPPPSLDSDLTILFEENKKLREELGRQGEQIDELNEEVDLLKQIIQSIEGFFGSIFG